MPGLTLDTFLQAGRDLEATQYRVEAYLRHTHDAFDATAIYPHLSDLVALRRQLTQLQEAVDDLRAQRPHALEGLSAPTVAALLARIDGEEDEERPELEALFRLVAWALPRIDEALEEGRTIFEFVEDTVHLQTVGLVPSYTDEGYLILPSAEERVVHVLRYRLTLFTQASERYRSLRTSHVTTVEEGVAAAPALLKLRLLEEERELPNPATFSCAAEVALPFEPTVLPVAKRKLMRYLCAGPQGEA